MCFSGLIFFKMLMLRGVFQKMQIYIIYTCKTNFISYDTAR